MPGRIAMLSLSASEDLAAASRIPINEEERKDKCRKNYDKSSLRCVATKDGSKFPSRPTSFDASVLPIFPTSDTIVPTLGGKGDSR
jgi:hypothetical protein